MTAGATPRARRARLALALFLLIGIVPVVLAPAAQARRAAPVVTVEVDDISPSTPLITPSPRPLVFSLTLTNTGETELRQVHLVADRDYPIGTEEQLAASLASTRAPQPDNRIPLASTPAVTVDLPPGAPVHVEFRTTSGISSDSGLCLCTPGSGAGGEGGAVYSLYFTAETVGQDGAVTELGATRTYVPAFQVQPERMRVSWVWPLIDRPHRLADNSVFLDDQLADSVSDNGRLDRALTVVENVGADVPLTLMIDPELLDELEVMATGKYSVRSGTKTTPGLGKAAAAAWLARLQGVLEQDPDLDVQLTPYADPDVQALTQRHLSWADTLPSTMSQRISTALAGRPETADLAWPPGGVITPATFRAITADGAGALVLDSASIVTTAGRTAPTRIYLSSQRAVAEAAVTVAGIQHDAASVVSLGGSGLAGLPRLVAQVAIRAVERPDQANYLTITPPRYVDAAPDAAARAIRETSRSVFATPVAVGDTLTRASGTTGVRLARMRTAAGELPIRVTDNVESVHTMLPAVRDLLTVTPLRTRTSPSPDTLLAELPQAVQRISSAAWRADSHLGGPSLGQSLADQLSTLTNGLLNGVHIVNPYSGTYTLASNGDPVPVAVRNTLQYAVRVRVTVTADVPGLSADPRTVDIEANSQVSVKVPTHVERSGRINVVAQLTTSAAVDLGPPIPLTVHSTALGTVGVVITSVAGAVLLLALVIRFALRIRNRTSWPRPVTADHDLDEVAT